jgi:putative ABC transport system permease protein
VSLLDGLRHRLDVLLHPRRFARELEDEFRFHLSLDALDQECSRSSGLSTAEAQDAARRRLGNLTSLAEETRHMAGLGFLDMARQDLGFAVRTFRRAPAFTLVAIVTLAVGIGANTAIFSAINTMLLRPLPFPDAGRLMKVSLIAPPRGESPGNDDFVWSYPKFVAFRDAQTVFQDLALFDDLDFTVRGEDGAERDHGEYAGAQYLTTLGVRPALGRNFVAAEDRTPGAASVVILSDAFWQRRFNADPAALGRTLSVNGSPYQIVGILPPGFRGLSGKADFLLPMMAQSVDELGEPWSHNWTLVARLKQGVTIPAAKAAVTQLGVVVDRAYPNSTTKERWGAVARQLDATRVDRGIRRSLLVLLGAVGLVLLIACANVANLFLVRAAGRRREIAVRLSLGAGRGRLVRQLLTESVLLGVAGGIASLALAWIGVHSLTRLDAAAALHAERFSGLGAVSFSSIRLDPAAFGFAALLAILTGLVFGLVPAIQATRPSLAAELKDDGQGGPVGRRGFSGRNLLVVAEIALAVVLLAGSGLMVRSLGKLLDVDPGFVPERVLTMRLNTGGEYPQDSLPAFYADLTERIGALPGVSAVGLSDCPPLNGGCNVTSIVFHDRPPVAAGTEPAIGLHRITAGWPVVAGVPLIEGRLFNEADRAGRSKALLINQTAARKFWPGRSAIGRPVGIGQGGYDTAYVVGVLGDTRYGTVDSVPVPDTYLSYDQSPRGRMMVFIKTTGDPKALAAPVRRVVNQLLPAAPVYDVQTMDSRVATSLGYARFNTILLTLFGIMALALSAVGTYGVIAFTVTQRRRELGIRAALGASGGNLIRMVVGQGARLATAGAVIGLVGALMATRLLRSLLYGVGPTDPATFIGIIVLLTAAVLLASWIPARRAAGADPSEVLRSS